MVASEQPRVTVWGEGLRGEWLEVEVSDALKDHGLMKRKNLGSALSPSGGLGWGSWR